MKKVHNIGFMKLVSVLTVLIMMFSAFGIGVMAEDTDDNVWVKVFYDGAENHSAKQAFYIKQ